jgi:hypothetical protein
MSREPLSAQAGAVWLDVSPSRKPMLASLLYYNRSLWHWLGLFQSVFFVLFQRRNFHQGPFCVGAMDRLAVVPQSLLREPFRIVDAIIELPDGRQIESIDASYTMHEQDVGTDGSISSNGSSSGTLLNRYAIVWFNPPYSADYSGRITRTLSFSNLISAPVTVTFTNGVPDKTDEVFQMHLR